MVPVTVLDAGLHQEADVVPHHPIVGGVVLVGLPREDETGQRKKKGNPEVHRRLDRLR